MTGKMNSPLFLLHAAIDFFEKGTAVASDRFKERDGKEIKFDSMIHPKLCMPAVNIIFGLELGLKGLLKHAGLDIKGHDIFKLYKSLDLGTKDRLIEHYNSHGIYDKYVSVRLLAGDGTGHSTRYTFYAPTKDEKGVKQLLNSHKEYFQFFRYLFEFDESKEYVFIFSYISNFTFSVLTVLGEKIGTTIVSKSVKRQFVE